MSDWFAGGGGAGFATAVIWTQAALILLVIVLVVIRFVRGMTAGTFVAGGRNRKTRLAVMDATAVDSHRRLVLVRRDDIEHLLLIGGPTDVVVEREIRLTAGRRPQSVFDVEDNEAQMQTPAQPPALPPLPIAPQAPQRQRAPEPTQLPPLPMRAAAPPPARPVDRAPQHERAAPPPRPVRQTGVRPPARAPSPALRSNSARLPPLPAGMSSTPAFSSGRQPPAQPNNLDDALLRELEVTFDTAQPASFGTPAQKSPQQPVEMTLDDEMTKLLGELSNNKR